MDASDRPNEPTKDRAIRAISEDGSFRVITLRTTDTAAGAIEAQKVEGETARVFAEMLTGAVLVRETMAPGYRVQCILKGPRKGSFVADSHPDGLTRGLVNFEGESRELAFDEGAVFQSIRVLPGGRLQQGLVAAPGGDVSAALMEYMQASEQVTSVVAVAALVDGGRVTAAGGYIVQLLPEVKRGPLEVMTERLESFRDLAPLIARNDADPERLMAELLHGFPHEVLESSEVRFGCNCTPARVVGALATLGREEIGDIVRQGSFLDVECDYCGRLWHVGPEQLRSLLEPS